VPPGPSARYARPVTASGVPRLLPGLLLVAALTGAAFALARVPGAQLLGPLVLALLLGVALRAALRRPLPASAAGVAFSARTLLRLGIVLLGVRLDARALVELGPWVLVGSAVGAAVAFAAIELAGRAWRVPTDLRRLVGIGTAICGASAIAAALPLVRRAPGERATPGGPAPVAIAAISLLGTVGVLGFVAVDAVAAWPAALLAALAGATLQEVGQAVAAGATVGGEHAQLALLVKLSRVVWLAPALLALGWWSRRTASPDGLPSDEDVTSHRPRVRPPLVPGFVLGFLGFGLLTSLGVVPPAWVAGIALGGTALTAAAMAAIGMGVDASAIGRSGRQALALGAVGFAALTLAMVGWYGLLLR
jgi:uncharacterized integral membrane protein (TIGR00698 family)